MSDLHELTQKTKEGNEWRGTIRITMDGEEKELTIRQLVDPEFEEVMRKIDRDELQALRDEMPEDLRDEYKELRQKDELDEDEQGRFEELEEGLKEKGPNMFDVLSEETFEGIRQCAKYAVEPDEEDLRQVFMDRAAEVEREYGVKVETPEDVKPAVQDQIEYMIDHSTNFVSFEIGMQALLETVDEEGN